VFGRGDLAYQGGNRHPVGTGPLKLREWERGRHLLLERFPKYWGPPSPAQTIEVAIEPDPIRALGQARRGEIDLLGRVPPAWVPEQLDSPALRGNFKIVRSQPARFTFVLWNLSRPPLDDPAVRRALSLGIDRARILDAVRHGVGRPIASPALGGGRGPDAIFDLAAAQKMLDEAGLPRASEGGLRQRNGKPVKLVLLVPNGSHEASEAARRVDEALGKLGIAVEPAVGDFAILLLRLKKGMFDGALLEWSGRDDDDLGPLFRGGGGQNYGGYRSKEVDALVDQLRERSSPGGAARRDLYERLARALDADPPALFLYAPDEVYLLSKRLAPARPAGDFLLFRDLGPAP
jgi:peptide/nickel transport system substrate-binding protein